MSESSLSQNVTCNLSENSNNHIENITSNGYSDCSAKESSKIRIPGSKTLQRFFRSRSSSPRRAKLNRRQAGKNPRPPTIATADSQRNNLKSAQRAILRLNREEAAALTNTFAWSSLSNLQFQEGIRFGKKLKSSLSFSNIEVSNGGPSRAPLLKTFRVTRSLEEVSSLEDSSFNPMRNHERRNIPKVFISIDDDIPQTPDREECHVSKYLTLDRQTDESLDSLLSGRSFDCISDSSEILSKSNTALNDDMPTKEGLGGVKIGFKSLPLRRHSRAETSSSAVVTRQTSIDLEPGEDGYSSAKQVDDEKISHESNKKILKKLGISLSSKDKTKSHSRSYDQIEAKSRLSEQENSSEESYQVMPERPARKGKLRELLSKDNVLYYKRSSIDILDDSADSSVAPAKHSKSFGEKVAEYLTRGGSKIQEQQRRLKSQIWSSVVTIVLVEAKNLSTMDPDGLCDPYAKFRLGNEKYKSKVEVRTKNPRWLEQFDFHLFDDQLLEVCIYDKDSRLKEDFLGKCVLDMKDYEREMTHHINAELECNSELPSSCPANILLLLTISGTTSSASVSDLISFKENPHEVKAIRNRYKASRTLHNMKDVGYLTVKVFKAQGLAAADFGVGKSDPFCVLELVNARLQTQTEYKTLCPQWNKIFTFDVKDMYSVLEVTVYDEDRDHKVDFLGKVAIPLYRIRNGEKKWYALKDKKLRLRAKGNYPQILLECSAIWNSIRGAIHAFDPKEEKYMNAEPKFKRQIFVRNVNRIRAFLVDIIDFGLFIKSLFEWESPTRSLIGFILFMVITYYFELYMVVLGLLLVFLKNYIVISIVGPRYHKEDDPDSSGNEDELDEDDKDKEEKKSLKEKLQAIQEVIATVQNAIGSIATVAESIKNTFNFTIPFLSRLMIVVLLVIMVVLYFVPLRFLVMLWGVAKFSRKLIRPNSVVNDEILDFLSRVPDNEQLKDFFELRLKGVSLEDRRRRELKKKKTS